MAEPATKEAVNYDLMTDEEFNMLPLPTGEDVDLDTGDIDEGVPQEATTSSERDEAVEEGESITEEGEENADETENEEAEDVEYVYVDEEGNEVAEEDVDEDIVEENVEETNKVNSIEELLKTKLKFGDSEIAINSVEELVVLAQRGLGANKRVQELAPQLKTISMLEANGLMDSEKLSFLIALDKKDPAAIKKLVASSGIDPFDVNVENAEEEYIPTDYTVSDEEFAITEAFNEISTTASYEDTLKTISSFDNTSKAEIRKDPSMISQLNAHHEDGTYKQIKAIVAKDRALGNLKGFSDFAAYKHVWKTVQEYSASKAGKPEAGHKNLTDDQNSGENLAGTEGTREAGHNTGTDTQVGNASAAARKAAEATNRNRGSQKAATINFDELSDEEIKNLEFSDVFND